MTVEKQRPYRAKRGRKDCMCAKEERIKKKGVIQNICQDKGPRWKGQALEKQRRKLMS